MDKKNEVEFQIPENSEAQKTNQVEEVESAKNGDAKRKPGKFTKAEYLAALERAYQKRMGGKEDEEFFFSHLIMSGVCAFFAIC